MSSDRLKKLTGKNPRDFEPVAFDVINKPDVELFKELVDSDDFLFDFVKQNVAKRLSKNCNEKNYENLISFLKFYSPSYEEFIISTLANFADEDLTDKMLDLFEKGTDEEKTYCAKFFSFIQDPLALDYLRENAFSENTYLSSNCASTLALLKDEEIFNTALEKLNSDDDFEKLDGVKFLVSYGNKTAIDKILQTMKTSAMPENIAGEIPYLVDLFELLKTNRTDGLVVLNQIINGLGEILGLGQVFDFQLYEVFERLLSENPTPESSVVLLNAKEKFETLTENDEYLFDETKDVKQEIFDVKKLLNNVDNRYKNLIDEEITEISPFVFTAIDLTNSTDKIRLLLHNTSNQTLILKSIEALKQRNNLTPQDKETALKIVTDDNIKNIINAI